MAGENEILVDDDDVITIDVSDNPELAGEEVVPTTKAAAEPAPKVQTRKAAAADEAAAALTRSLETAEADRVAALATAEAERRRADAASHRAAALESETQGYRERVENQELTIITNGIDAAKAEMAAARVELRAAKEAGDFDKEIEAQEKMSIAAAALDRLNESKVSVEAGAKKPAITEGRVETPAAPATTAFEGYVSGFAPAAQAWLRAHPECVPANVGGTAKKNAAMMKGHYAAIEQNIAPNTPEYFQVIEETVGYRSPTSAASEVISAGDEPAPAAAAKPKTQQRQVQPSAPVSRDPPAANGAPRTTRSVQLTRDQQDAAKMSFPHLEPKQAFALYARNLVELEAEGKLGRMTH